MATGDFEFEEPGPDNPPLSFQEILATGIKHAGGLAHLAAWEKECWDRTAAAAYARETPDELLDPSRQPTRAYAQLLEEQTPRHDRLAQPSFDQQSLDGEPARDDVRVLRLTLH